MNEAQSGGLIDKYFFLNWIVIPLIIIGFLIGIIYLIGLYLSCPYIEDVSGCFPYNLPTWVKLISPIVLVVCLIVLFLLSRYVSKEHY